mmetsp:Transcript_30297/g.66633  ORF Transcript_30297/g.66633 Transcript_30297/m.66633 type:complete len:1070 (+) Transcript_30297:61-3270(+)
MHPRLIGFLFTHCITFVAEVAAIAFFIRFEEPLFCSCIVTALFFSGAFCTHAAWNCPTPESAELAWWLPLRNWHWFPACLLTIPFGFMQLVVVFLALEEYVPTPGRERGQSIINRGTSKYSIKAVNGIFEGCVCSAVMMYSFWSLGYEPVGSDHAITTQKWDYERYMFVAVGCIMFFTSGLGLLELDFCTSRAIAKCMRQPKYEIMHYLFRTCEVISRASIFLTFMVVTRETWFFWLPLFVDFVATLGLVTYFGGAEAAPLGVLVRLLCSVPCTFANVFLFIDTPYKALAARRLSRCLTVKNAAEQIILPLVLLGPCVWMSHDDRLWDAEAFLLLNPVTNFLVFLLATPAYWILLWCIHSPHVRGKTLVDIYSACMNGSVSDLRTATKALTQGLPFGQNAGFDVNCYDIHGRTPLMFAALYGHLALCKHLIREGARVNQITYDDQRPFVKWASKLIRRRWTALHIAAWQGHIEIVKELLRHVSQDEEIMRRGRSDWCDSRGDTPLHVACKGGTLTQECAVEIARARPEWVHAKNRRNRTPTELVRSQQVREELQNRFLHSSSPQTSLLQISGISTSGHGEMRTQSSAEVAEPSAAQLERAWPQNRVDIARTNLGPAHAPGLCSYVVSCCGGALGQVFLVEESTRPRQDNLSVITEESAREATEAPPPHDREAGFPIQHLWAVDKDNRKVDYLWWSATTQPDSHTTRRCCGGAAMNVTPDQLSSKPPKPALLGEGAQGAVWRAMDKNTRGMFAVKNVKLRSGNTCCVAQREYDVASHLKVTPHPCIVKLLHIHAFQDSTLTIYCLVMEYCPGGNLYNQVTLKYNRGEKGWSGRDGRYEMPIKAPYWLAQVFLGLELMHLRSRTLLRDIKLENVVLDETGCAKLTDFGFGRQGVYSDGHWTFGYPTGTPGYVAPEILYQEEYDARADLYSFGVLMWVLTTGGLRHKPGLPPTAGQAGDHFQVYKNDWQLLLRCLDHASHDAALQCAPGCSCAQDIRGFSTAGVQPLPTLELEQLVRSLVQRDFQERPEHAAIRAHPVMQQLQLPALDASKDQVEAWINEFRERFRPSSSSR